MIPLVMGSALFAAFSISDYDPRTSQLAVLDCFPSNGVCCQQYAAWDAHIEQLQAVRDRKPHMRERAQRWIDASVGPRRFWHLLACAHCVEATAADRLRWIRTFEDEFPHAYRTGICPPILPTSIVYD